MFFEHSISGTCFLLLRDLIETPEWPDNYQKKMLYPPNYQKI